MQEENKDKTDPQFHKTAVNHSVFSIQHALLYANFKSKYQIYKPWCNESYIDYLSTISIEENCLTFENAQDFYLEDPIDNEIQIKIILRPISDFRKDEFFDLYMDLCESLEMVNCENLLIALEKGNYYAIDIKKYHIIEEFMCKNHFDWKYNLIEKGLAISIHDVE